jgi:hypothetical protein
MQQCIDDCLDCHRTCLYDAMNHCLETGGEHIAPAHFRLMMNCAQICQTAADFMLSASHLHARVCAACAEVCEACALSCEQVGDMDECVQVCRRCAESCRTMAGAAAAHGLAGSARQDSDAPVKAPM